ncbi:MAG TPA: methyltransferase domain-containing protein [Acidimicrobiales bacterium]|nr:methyltransferase domain-containing protein [Acidimicrobiales bacterium]
MMLPSSSPDPTRKVAEYFDEQADHWRSVYEAGGVEGLIYRQRQQAAEELVGRAGAAPRDRLLEVGPGAGRLSLRLTELGWRVHAIDISPAMVGQTRLGAVAAEVGDRLTLAAGDVQKLAFRDASFDAAVAVGVVPWLPEPLTGLRELHRVLRPGAHLVVTSDNRNRLTHLVDPVLNPWLRSVYLRVMPVLAGAGLWRGAQASGGQRVEEQRYTVDAMERLLGDAGFRVLESRTIGFWPFTLRRHHIFGPQRSLHVHRRLQDLADSPRRFWATAGNHHLVLAARIPSGRGLATNSRRSDQKSAQRDQWPV